MEEEDKKKDPNHVNVVNKNLSEVMDEKASCDSFENLSFQWHTRP